MEDLEPFFCPHCHNIWSDRRLDADGKMAPRCEHCGEDVDKPQSIALAEAEKRYSALVDKYNWLCVEHASIKYELNKLRKKCERSHLKLSRSPGKPTKAGRRKT